jgi:hypothetical protein
LSFKYINLSFPAILGKPDPIDPAPPIRIPPQGPLYGYASVDHRTSLFLNVDRQPVLCLFNQFMDGSLLYPETGWSGNSRHLSAVPKRCEPFDYIPDSPVAGVFHGDDLRPPPSNFASSIDGRQLP